MLYESEANWKACANEFRRPFARSLRIEPAFGIDDRVCATPLVLCRQVVAAMPLLGSALSGLPPMNRKPAAPPLARSSLITPADGNHWTLVPRATGRLQGVASAYCHRPDAQLNWRPAGLLRRQPSRIVRRVASESRLTSSLYKIHCNPHQYIPTDDQEFQAPRAREVLHVGQL